MDLVVKAVRGPRTGGQCQATKDTVRLSPIETARSEPALPAQRQEPRTGGRSPQSDTSGGCLATARGGTPRLQGHREEDPVCDGPGLWGGRPGSQPNSHPAPGDRELTASSGTAPAPNTQGNGGLSVPLL